MMQITSHSHHLCCNLHLKKVSNLKTLAKVQLLSDSCITFYAFELDFHPQVRVLCGKLPLLLHQIVTKYKKNLASCQLIQEFSFTGSMLDTIGQSLHHSCRSLSIAWTRSWPTFCILEKSMSTWVVLQAHILKEGRQAKQASRTHYFPTLADFRQAI